MAHVELRAAAEEDRVAYYARPVGRDGAWSLVGYLRNGGFRLPRGGAELAELGITDDALAELRSRSEHLAPGRRAADVMMIVEEHRVAVPETFKGGELLWIGALLVLVGGLPVMLVSALLLVSARTL